MKNPKIRTRKNSFTTAQGDFHLPGIMTLNMISNMTFLVLFKGWEPIIQRKILVKSKTSPIWRDIGNSIKARIPEILCSGKIQFLLNGQRVKGNTVC